MKNTNTKLLWRHVRITPTFWNNRNGERRVHVSLKGASFVMHTFWIKDPDFTDLGLRERILKKLNAKLLNAAKRVAKYL